MPPTLATVLAVSAAEAWLAVGALAWVSAGVAAAATLARRGHHLRSLLGLGLVLGPLFVPLAVEFVRRREPACRPIALDPPAAAGAGRHAIVAVLGAPESVVDALPILASFGTMSALTLATTIDYESAGRGATDEVRTAAERRVTAAAAFLTDVVPSRVLVPGPPAAALARLVAPDHDVIVITGATQDVGSERLSAEVGIPVVVAPRPRARGVR